MRGGKVFFDVGVVVSQNPLQPGLGFGVQALSIAGSQQVQERDVVEAAGAGPRVPVLTPLDIPEGGPRICRRRGPRRAVDEPRARLRASRLRWSPRLSCLHRIIAQFPSQQPTRLIKRSTYSRPSELSEVTKGLVLRFLFNSVGNTTDRSSYDYLAYLEVHSKAHAGGCPLTYVSSRKRSDTSRPRPAERCASQRCTVLSRRRAFPR